MSTRVPTRSSIILVTGPSRSGKSEWAEWLAQQSAQQSQRSVVYVATARVSADDPEWQQRIQQHQNRRPADWQTCCEPVHLAQVLKAATASQCLLIDSLGTWLANVLEQDEAAWQQTRQELLDSVQQTAAQTIFVAEEVGWGVVPAYPLGRSFRDRLGQITRSIGAIADAVYLVTAGYAIDLKTLGTPVPNLSIQE